MADRITRRDFMNGIAIGALGAAGLGWTAAARAEPVTGPVAGANDPPARTGLRGSHPGSFEMAHAVRDGRRPDYSNVTTDERYDLVVVGAGLSGLSAAYFYRQRHPRARVLLLDTNDDFGGHAKRNEFDVDGHRLIGYGGTQSIDGPRRNYSKVARHLLSDLGVRLSRFDTAFDQTLYEKLGLTRAVFFKKEAFGVDRLVRQQFGPWNDWDEALPPGQESQLRDYLAQVPISDPARAKLYEMYTSDRDVLAGHSPEQRRHILTSTTCRDFLKTYWQADDEVLRVLHNRTHALWAVGIDAVPAGVTLALPGMQGLVEARAKPEEEPYIYHFPDGNASLARLLVRRLVPGSAAGHSMEDIVTAQFDYAKLDTVDSPVTIRLQSTAIAVRNVDKAVEVVYSQAGRLRRVAADHAILACYHAMIPYLAEDALEPDQRAALHDNVRAPLVYATLAVRNWHAWHRLGVAYITNPAGKYEASLDFPVSLGGYRAPRDPSQPICLHLEHTPCAPDSGLDMRAQYRIGRGYLYTASFEELEADIRDELGRMLGAGGFDFDRDVAAITINRWPHGYSYTPTPLYDDPEVQKARRAAARRAIGRISIAGADSGWDAYTHVAIDEAHRAVLEISS